LKRVTIALDPQERAEFAQLRGVPGAAYSFWKRVCGCRGLDYATLIMFTALPLGHGRQWCWPMPLQSPPVPPWLRREL